METTEPKVIQDLEGVWPFKKKRGKNMYLYWRNHANSENHGHIFYHENHKQWNYNIKCNANKGNDRIRHRISQRKPAKSLKTEIKEHWRKECPDFIEKTNITKTKSRPTIKKNKKHTVKKNKKL